MRFLKGGDAIIIDMRQNGGGSPDAVRYMISHFLEPNTPIVTFYMRGDPAEKLTTLASLPAGRLTGKPLYVLTGGRSASAAEEFIGHVGGYKIGELVGEKTAGAGYRNEFFPVAGGYVISVSVGRAVLASTGKDWEKVGIAPTIKATQSDALEAAQIHALRKLASSATGRDKEVFEGSAQVLEAQLKPVPHRSRCRNMPVSTASATSSTRAASSSSSAKGGPRDSSWPSGLTSSPSLRPDAAREVQDRRQCGDGAPAHPQRRKHGRGGKRNP